MPIANDSPAPSSLPKKQPSPAAPKATSSYKPPVHTPMGGTHTIQNYKGKTKEDYYVKVGNKSSADTSDFRRGGGASVPVTVDTKKGPKVATLAGGQSNTTPYAPGAARPTILRGRRETASPRVVPVAAQTGGPRGGGNNKPFPYHPYPNGAVVQNQPYATGAATPAGVGIKGGGKPAPFGNVSSTVPSVSYNNGTKPIPKQGGGQSGNSNSQSDGIIKIAHGNNNDKGGRARGGVFEAGKGGRAKDFGGSTAVAVGPNGSAGLSDIEKVRKFTFQVEKTQGKLDTLKKQESQIRAAMAGATDPAQQRQLVVQLGNVQQQQQKATERLANKQSRLDKVENRMAAAGVTPSDQGVRAVAVAGIGNKNNNGDKNGGKNAGVAQGGVFQASNNGGRNNNALAGVGGPNGGRPQVGVANTQSNNGSLNGGANFTFGGAKDGRRAQGVAVGDGMGGKNGGNGQGNGGRGQWQQAVAVGGGNGGRKNNDGPNNGGRPQAVAVGAQNNGVPGNGGGGNFAFGGAQDGRPQAVSFGSGGNGNGNKGNKKDNDGPKLMGGPVGGGKNDSLPTNPPKLAGLGGGGGLGGGLGKGGGRGKNR